MKKKQSHLINKKWWEQMVDEECGFTKPWLNLNQEMVEKYAKGQIKNPLSPLNEIWPVEILANLKNKKVLCLAAGGGQQSAIFGLLGADVTVFDIAEKQLAGDQKAAHHYGYRIKTIQGDMSDLKEITSNYFDLVYQAPSMCYVSDIRKVYQEVFRVLKKGGTYRADAHNPQSVFLDERTWDGIGYRIATPYDVKEKQRNKASVIEHRHYLDETFNGLIESEFLIEKVCEMPKELYQTENDQPGSWGHSLLYLPGIFAILARKK